MELQEHLEYIRAGCLEEAKCGDKRMSRKERARAQEAGNRDLGPQTFPINHGIPVEGETTSILCFMSGTWVDAGTQTQR